MSNFMGFAEKAANFVAIPGANFAQKQTRKIPEKKNIGKKYVTQEMCQWQRILTLWSEPIFSQQ